MYLIPNILLGFVASDILVSNYRLVGSGGPIEDLWT